MARSRIPHTVTPPGEAQTPNTPLSESVQIVRARRDSGRTTLGDFVSVEQPLEIRIRGRSVAVTMRTPGNDRELAAGFILSENLIQHPGQIVDVAHCRRGEAEYPENIVNVFLPASVDLDWEKLTRHFFASSSCGICGKASLEAVRENWAPVESRWTLSSKVLLNLPDRLHGDQTAFHQTGGLHAAALVRASGETICVREDVGRHNAVDKVIGWSLLENHFPLTDYALMVSGRASFEIMQKALAARVPIVAAVSAPSSLAVEFAKENGQTLVGFLRESGFNIYSHPERILND